MKVTRKPKNPGPAAWAKILPEAAHHPNLEDDLHVDFVIIGGGFAGLTAARRISELEPTATVAVVEAFRLAEGPAGRNSGFMIDLPHDLASDDYGGQAARDHQSIRHNRAAISYAADMVVVVGSSNAVNLTDGLDGLAILPTVMVAVGLGMIAYVTGRVDFASYLNIAYIAGAGEMVVFCGAIAGAGLGFLWFNTYPAMVFMGDVGALALGAALGIVAVIIRQELVLFIMGGVFVIETLSVLACVFCIQSV